jgi:hypothetical protein
MERILKWLEDGEGWLNRGREILGQLLTDPPAQGLVWDKLQFKTKEGQPADAADDWSWAFVADREGVISPEIKPIVDYLKRYEKARIQGYEYTLSKNGQFFNRRRLRQA